MDAPVRGPHAPRAPPVLAERELTRIGARPEQLAALARELRARDVDHLHQLLGEGEITVTQLMHAANRLFEPAPPARMRGPKAASAYAAVSKLALAIFSTSAGVSSASFAIAKAPAQTATA